MLKTTTVLPPTLPLHLYPQFLGLESTGHRFVPLLFNMGSKDEIDPFSTERARATLAVCIVFLILATLAVAARFWARRIKGVKLALDDWLVVVSLIFYYLSAIETMLQLGIGRLGHHANGGISPDQLRKNGKVREIFPLSSSVDMPNRVPLSLELSDSMLMHSRWARFDGLSVPYYIAYLLPKYSVDLVSTQPPLSMLFRRSS